MWRAPKMQLVPWMTVRNSMGNSMEIITLISIEWPWWCDSFNWNYAALHSSLLIVIFEHCNGEHDENSSDFRPAGGPRISWCNSVLQHGIDPKSRNPTSPMKQTLFRQAMMSYSNGQHSQRHINWISDAAVVQFFTGRQLTSCPSSLSKCLKRSASSALPFQVRTRISSLQLWH